MGSIQSYQIEFIERTKDILTEDYHHFNDKDREVTFLMNCLLGLIVTVSEEENRKLKVFKGKIDDNFICLVPKKIGFVKEIQEDLTDMSVTKLNVQVGHWDDLKREDKFWFLNKIRNAIAHQNIKGMNENEKWVGVSLYNETNSKIKDFEITFTIEELRTFATKISEKYLNEKNLQQTEQLVMFP